MKKLTADPQLEDLTPDEQHAFAITVTCPSCGRVGGLPCLAMNGNRMPLEMVGRVHMRRINAAREPYRLLVAQNRGKS